MGKSLQVIGILIALATFVVTLLTWLMPFDSVGLSPFSQKTTVVPQVVVTVAADGQNTMPDPTIQPIVISTVPPSTAFSILSVSGGILKVDRRTARWQGAFNIGIDQALSLVEEALQRVDIIDVNSIELTEDTPTRKVVNAEVGVTLESGGEDIEVVLETETNKARVEAGYLTQITITSRSIVKITLFDLGKNEDNINIIIVELLAKK